MKILILILLFQFINAVAWPQAAQITINGKVLDAKTKAPLSYATVGMEPQTIKLSAGHDGRFELNVPVSAKDDSLFVSHIGYRTVKKRIGDIVSPVIVLMEEYPIELRAVTVTSRTLSLKEIDKALRKIKDNLYAYETEVSNGLYNLFLSYLEENGYDELLKQCTYDWTSFNNERKTFYKNYSLPQKTTGKVDTSENFTDFPAVNIPHPAAVLFCQWLTEQYNGNPGKKKFAKVTFRLPSLKEWQIAALGYAKFQSWELLENKVEVVIPPDTISALKKGRKAIIPVNKEILYPWWTSYNYRKKATNANNCYMGNFNSPESVAPCAWGQLPNSDGWWKMARTASYFPNGFGLYDMVGNVAEMVAENGVACGGSWNDLPEESTIHSVKTYTKPDASIGFRIFMEVQE